MRNGGVVMGAIALGLLLSSGGEAGESETEVATGRPASDINIEDFAWMAGYWRGEGLGGVCEEIWTEPLAGSMIGLFRLVRDGEPMFSEHMTLGADANGFALKVKHFTPDFVAWEDKEGAIRFSLEELRPSEAVFKGLRFRRTDEGNLEITIRMKQKGGETKDEVIKLRPHPPR
jgi:hypothetical protein